MIPQAALYMLIIVVAICTLTFSIAVYHTIKTRIQASKAEGSRENDMTLPLTEMAVPPAIQAPPTRSPTPEAESPPPIEDGVMEFLGLPATKARVSDEGARDSVHELIDLYTREGRRKDSPAPNSAPATTTTFTQSKWASFGGRQHPHNSMV
jgi:hypothetical protein